MGGGFGGGGGGRGGDGGGGDGGGAKAIPYEPMTPPHGSNQRVPLQLGGPSKRMIAWVVRLSHVMLEVISCRRRPPNVSSLAAYERVAVEVTPSMFPRMKCCGSEPMGRTPGSTCVLG